MPETRESGTPPNFGPFDLAAHYVKFSEKPNEFRKKSGPFPLTLLCKIIILRYEIEVLKRQLFY